MHSSKSKGEASFYLDKRLYNLSVYITEIKQHIKTAK